MIIDTNVILHLIGPSSATRTRIERCFTDQLASAALATNEIVFAEIASHFSSAAEVSDGLASLGISIERVALEEFYRAGSAFREYRGRGGPRAAILPDFVIGAQAEHRGWPIMTCDTARFRSYFPTVELIDPTEYDL